MSYKSYPQVGIETLLALCMFSCVGLDFATLHK